MNGCKYPGTPEPCEGYREVMEVLAEAEEALNFILENEDPYGDFWLPSWVEKKVTAALTRINRLKDIDQLREKE